MQEFLISGRDVVRFAQALEQRKSDERLRALALQNYRRRQWSPAYWLWKLYHLIKGE